MSNIRTVNKRHKRAVATRIVRNQSVVVPAHDTPAAPADEPVRAAS